MGSGTGPYHAETKTEFPFSCQSKWLGAALVLSTAIDHGCLPTVCVSSEGTGGAAAFLPLCCTPSTDEEAL